MIKTNKGYIYVLSHPEMPGLVKIGMTTKGGEDRARQLCTTGVPGNFVLEFEILTPEAAACEFEIHKALAQDRIQGRELFRVDVDKAVATALKACAECFDVRVADQFECEYIDLIPHVLQAGEDLDVDYTELCGALSWIEREDLERCFERMAETQRRNEEHRRKCEIEGRNLLGRG